MVLERDHGGALIRSFRKDGELGIATESSVAQTGACGDEAGQAGQSLGAADMTPMAAMKSSTGSSFRVLVVTFLKTSPAFFTVSGAVAVAAPRACAAAR